MNTYGYIREATMARLDIDETEAEAMNLLSRFHIYANEAMQAICASKPKYEYIEVTVVKELSPIVLDGESFRLATETEIYYGTHENVNVPEGVLPLANEEQTKEYWHERNTYSVGEIVPAKPNFIAFADKKCFLTVKLPVDLERYNFIGKTEFGFIPTERKVEAKSGKDFAYIGNNALKFYREGFFQIPAKFFWHKFVSAESDDEVLDMPIDILMCIPIYIAATCYQIDNLQKAQVVKQEFELALARCTSTDFMENKSVTRSW